MHSNVHRPPSKALYCTCNVRVVSQKPFAKALPTYPPQRKLHEMRCPASLARELRSFANKPQPSSHHLAQKPQQRRATSIAVIPKKVYLCAPSPPSGTFTCRQLSVRPPLLLDEYGIVAYMYCKQANIGVPPTTSLDPRETSIGTCPYV